MTTEQARSSAAADEPTMLAARPGWFARRKQRLQRRWRCWRQPSTVQLNGVVIRIDRAAYSDKIVQRLYDGGYEAEECAALARTLSPDDTVLELGSGLGYLSAFAAQRIGSDRVTTCEANPRLAPIIGRTHADNGVAPRQITGVLSPNGDGSAVPFYVHRRHFWSSSLIDLGTDYERVNVPGLSWPEQLAAIRPSYLVMDIEGGELALLGDFQAESVTKLLVEFHPGKTGQAPIDTVWAHLAAQGFERQRVAPGPHVYYFQRAASAN